MTIAPEIRDALVKTGSEHLSARKPAMRPPARFRLRALGRRGLPTVLIGLVAAGGVATAGDLIVRQHDKDRAAQLAASPSPTTGPAETLGEAMARAAAEIEAQLPYPPGMPDTYDWHHYSAGATLGSGHELRREIQQMVEFRAQCLWNRYYVKSFDAHDTRGMADAAQILRDALRWPTLRVVEQGTASAAPPRVLADEAQHRRLSSDSRRFVQINCYDRSRDELTGKVPLVPHSD